MAFSAYKQQTDVEALGVNVNWNNFIPSETFMTIQPTELLEATLARGAHFGKVSEKAKSELIIAPVILEVIFKNSDDFSLLSGINLEVKRGENGKSLKGAVDFLLCKGKKLIDLKSPLAVIVESKKGELELGYWQCAAEMAAAQQFNFEKAKSTDAVWGCVTIGLNWQFLNLKENHLTIEDKIYTLNDLPQLLGAWQWILDQCR